MKLSVSPARVVIYALLLAAALFALFPLYVMAITSLKSMAEIRAGNLFAPPVAPNLAAWQKAWSSACTGVSCEGLRSYFFNSMVIVVPAVVISTLLGAVTGYSICKWRFRGAGLLFGALLFGCFVPFQIVILPMAQMLGKLQLANTTAGLVLVHVVYGLAFTTLFYRNFFVSVPDDLIKAAKIDGAGFFGIFWRVLLPVSLPITVVCLVWQFTQIWNDFLFGVVFASGDAQPVTVALNNLVNTSTGVKEYNVDMAAAIYVGLPAFLVYVLAGKYFVRGLTAGAVKG